MKEYIKPFSCAGMTCFLCQVFIIQPVADLTPSRLVMELERYHDVGLVVYKRVRSKKPFDNPFLEVTILQLFASGMVCFNIEPASKPKALCKLAVDDNMSPEYLNDTKWGKLFLIESYVFYYLFILKFLLNCVMCSRF